MMDAEARLIRCFAAVFPGKTEEQIRHASAESFGEWDSVAAITLLTVVQEEFGVEIQPEELPELTSFTGIFSCVAAEKR